VVAGRRQFGRVRRLPSGRWQARYSGPDGRDHAAPRTFATKTEASRWLSALETDLSRSQWLDPSRGELAFGQYATEWLAGRADLKLRTLESYTWLLGKYLLPEFGDVPMNRITPSLVRAWHARLLRPGTGRSSLRLSYALLRAICNTAMRDEVLLRNPCMIRGAGSQRPAERQVVTLTQLDELVAAMPPRYRALVLLAAWSGARWGELVALSWDRLDLTAGRMTIDRQLVELRTGNRLHLDTPKTAAGRRTVHLPPHLLPELEAHRQAYVPADCAWVFPNQHGQPLRRSSFQSTWWVARGKVGLPWLHFHDLRHTGNTLAASTGASTRELMARMGHASMQAALIYQHASPERDEAIARALSQIALTRTAPLALPPAGPDAGLHVSAAGSG